MFVGGISMKIVNLRKFIRSIMILLFLIFGISVFFSKATLSYKQLEYENTSKEINNFFEYYYISLIRKLEKAT